MRENLVQKQRHTFILITSATIIIFGIYTALLIFFFNFSSEISYAPEQIHLSWTENEGEMRVTWVTQEDVNCEIQYRVKSCESDFPSSEWQTVNASYTIFNKGTSVVSYQYIHTGVITGLNASCFYEYKVGNLFSSSETFVFSGRTPDTQAPYDTSPVKLIIIGDWGTGMNAKFTGNLLMQESSSRDFDGIIHTGDFAYDLNDLEGTRGDEWLRMVQPIAANFAYMTLPGNHEDFNNFTHYKNRFNMPKNELNDGTGYFYSFDMGPAHFVLINTESYFVYSNDTIEVQMQWLLNDLAQANENREIRPWLIVMSHHPLYCSADWRFPPVRGNAQCRTESVFLQANLEEAFYKYGVDVYVQAHVHNYERDAPIYQNLTVLSEFDGPNIHVGPKAPVYITNGSAGNSEGHNNPTSRTPQDWARYLSNDYGYGRLIVYNNTHFYYEQFSAPYATEIDYVWIVKTQNSYNLD